MYIKEVNLQIYSAKMKTLHRYYGSYYT